MATTLQTQVCMMLAVVVEISAKKWVVASHGGGTGTIRKIVLSQLTPEARLAALLAEIDKARERFGVSRDARVVVAYEAGQEGHWLARALRARSVEVEEIDPKSLQVDRRAKRAKTDRLDAEALVRALWRWMGGDGLALRMVRVPSEVEEDDREWQRERDRLASEQRSCQDRIQKKLRTQGIWINLGRADRKRLREGHLRRVDGTPLAPVLQQMLTIELDRLEAAQARLKQLDAQLDKLSVAAARRTERLARLRGIGPLGSRTLALLLFWRSFDNRRQVGACTGLAGTPYDSGESQRDQGISKAGDGRVRATLIELAWLWQRYQPESAITQWFKRRTQGASKRGKRILIVAVARRLAIALWRYLSRGEIPEGAILKAAPSL
jgi:transposase